jgi:hypothetical protein
MKKGLLTFIMIVAAFSAANRADAQIQKGNVMIGGDVANLDIGLKSGSNTTFTLTPKAAWFVQDRLAIGAQALFGWSHVSGGDNGDIINYGFSGLGRYYLSDPSIELVNKGRFFLEADLGLNGRNQTKGGASTNGLGLGFGPGFAYFITPNIGIEALLKYNGIVGFGSDPYQDNLTFAVGLQIYLPRSIFGKK